MNKKKVTQLWNKKTLLLASNSLSENLLRSRKNVIFTTSIFTMPLLGAVEGGHAVVFRHFRARLSPIGHGPAASA